MKSSALISGLLLGIISQTSAAIMRIPGPSADIGTALHGTLGDTSGVVAWSGSFTEMQDRLAEGQRLAHLPPPKWELGSPLAANDAKEAALGPSTLDQHLDVKSEQYKTIQLADRRILKGGSGKAIKFRPGAGSLAADTPFSTKLTWVFLAGHLAMLRHWFARL
ncbi:uncharacterized protein MELLADRAFT_108708 [Melampsora larici-populina 98AG31]|uniref:Secreted protein n=1 Tax=Melampsora larici-populina (strain 98AG31 / pathotype 3-4-7) TaxID=747676 RepID=F4RTZ5_MELLP|nr:uncharacterized protein MELLADRAFT_108708 [Melampsora larici-populina 98AG31]EGG04173.1 secreted protein [Melampsora larici-populina 98AG31]